MAAVVCSRSSHGPPAASRPSQPPRTPNPSPDPPPRPGGLGHGGARGGGRQLDGRAQKAMPARSPNPSGSKEIRGPKGSGARDSRFTSWVPASQPEATHPTGPRLTACEASSLHAGLALWAAWASRASAPSPPDSTPSRPRKGAWHLASAPARHAGPQSWLRSGERGPDPPLQGRGAGSPACTENSIVARGCLSA